MPKVSVIVPNYNHAKYLNQRIDCILNQTFQDFEIIILDDKSTDNSKDVIETYRHNQKVTQIIYNEENSGSTFKQWNKGVALASGDWIWIAESDDYSDITFLETLMNIVSTDSEISLLFSNSFFVDHQGEIILNPYADVSKPSDPTFEKDFIAEGKSFCCDYLLSPIIGNASSAILKKNVFEKIGGADGTLKLCGDWKMWHDMLLHGNLGYTSKKLNYFRHHTNNVRSSKGAEFFLYEIIKVVIGFFPKLSLSNKAKEKFLQQLFKEWVFWMGHRRSEISKKTQVKIFMILLKNDSKFLQRIIFWPLDKMKRKIVKAN